MELRILFISVLFSITLLLDGSINGWEYLQPGLFKANSSSALNPHLLENKLFQEVLPKSEKQASLVEVMPGPLDTPKF